MPPFFFVLPMRLYSAARPLSTIIFHIFCISRRAPRGSSPKDTKISCAAYKIQPAGHNRIVLNPREGGADREKQRTAARISRARTRSRPRTPPRTRSNLSSHDLNHRPQRRQGFSAGAAAFLALPPHLCYNSRKSHPARRPAPPARNEALQ